MDVVLRRKGSRQIVHLINRASGISNRPNDGTVDEIPRAGPVEIEIQLDSKPGRVYLAFEKEALKWQYKSGKKGGRLWACLPGIHIHAALVIE